ncbi:MAG: DUF4430 domain-containing protein [Tissierellia bacterium]|nr:DUF4430 domain-containing protein [Tissierellia bacterium]
MFPEESQKNDQSQTSDNQLEADDGDISKPGGNGIGESDNPGQGGEEDLEGPLIGDEPGEDEAGLVTDLFNGIILTSEIDSDILNFYAYYSDPRVDANLRVNYKHRDDSGNGLFLTPNGKDYQSKLKLGLNYLTVYYNDSDGVRRYTRFAINYQAKKADEDETEVGENPPIISTNLDTWEGPISQAEFIFTVDVKTWENKRIYSDSIQVRMDGKLLTNPTGSGVYEYELNFPIPNEGEKSHHIVSVLAWDKEGNSRYQIYRVEYQFYDDGQQIGNVRIIIDATTVSLGIIDVGTVELIQGETVAHAVTKMLDDYGYTFTYGGSLTNGFYLRSISRGDSFLGSYIDGRLKTLLERDGVTFTSSGTRDKLGEFDFTRDSGWMYSVNGSLYPGRSMSAWKLNNGDVVTLRFTLAQGKDIGGSGNSEGNLSSYCGIWIDGGFIALSHNYIETDRLEPTGSTAGYIEYTCSKCGDIKIEELEATGEEDDEEETPPVDPPEDDPVDPPDKEDEVEPVDPPDEEPVDPPDEEPVDPPDEEPVDPSDEEPVEPPEEDKDELELPPEEDMEEGD